MKKATSLCLDCYVDSLVQRSILLLQLVELLLVLNTECAVIIIQYLCSLTSGGSHDQLRGHNMITVGGEQSVKIVRII